MTPLSEKTKKEFNSKLAITMDSVAEYEELRNDYYNLKNMKVLEVNTEDFEKIAEDRYGDCLWYIKEKLNDFSRSKFSVVYDLIELIGIITLAYLLIGTYGDVKNFYFILIPFLIIFLRRADNAVEYFKYKKIVENRKKIV